MRQLYITKQITHCDTDSLDKYLQEINREHLITTEEESILAQKIKQGDEKAMQKLIVANLRFVVSVAKQYQHRGLSLSDLINEGNIGLIKAARQFDETRGFKLISYAVWSIRQSIQLAIKEQSNMVRLPSNKIDKINKIRKTVTKMEQQFLREPSYEEVGNELGLSAEVVNDALNASMRQVSMDAPLAGSEDLTLMDTIEDTDADNTGDELVLKSLRKQLKALINTLSSEEAEVLHLIFGFDNNKPLTFEQIAAHFGVTRERVRQIKERALRKLKHTSRSRVLREYLA